MKTIDRFDPFNDRLCRDVRNALSEAFITALARADLEPVREAADALAAETLPEPVKAYLDRRLAAYADVLATIGRHPSGDPLEVAFRIWDRRLFFETHEYLEQFWMAADGEDRKLLQAVIRAAGAYVHLEQGNLAGAAKIAAKAVDAIERRQDLLSNRIDPRILLEKLRNLDPDPPILSGTAAAATPAGP